MILVLVQSVVAIGLRPAKTTVDFTPGLEQESSFTIVNNDQTNFSVKVYAAGELAKYLEFGQDELLFNEHDESKKVSFKLNLPQKLPPGELNTDLVVEELVGESENAVSAKLVLKHKLIVRIPALGKFVEAKISSQKEENDLKLFSEVKNIGTEPIKEIKTKFSLYEGWKKIYSAETTAESLALGETKMLSVMVPQELVNYGEFDLLAEVSYDKNELVLEEKLILGEPEVEILSFDKYFIQGEINPFLVSLENKWNKKLKDLFIDVLVFKDQEQIDSIRTASFDLKAHEEEQVKGYFDADKELGDYIFEVVVNYNGKKSSQKFIGSILIKEDYNQVVESSGSWLLLGIVLILIILGFGTLILYRKRNQDLN
ncbi:MAG: hypothetical protein ABIH82_04570 [Candidatus Woesearchaeota archaeon]|nr:hypothetical protein [Nanoarchaeota archaeon]